MSVRSAQAIADSLAPRSTVLNFNNMDLKDLPQVFTRALADGTLSSYAGVSLKSNRLPNVPLHLAKMQTLRVIWLDDNRIAALPPMGMFSHVQYLSLRKNRITKLPNSVGDLSSLILLDVSENQIARLPHELARLTYLKLVIATGNLSLRSLPLELARNTATRVEFETPATFPPDLSATGVLEYIEAMNERKLALSLTSHWARTELTCRVCTSRFPGLKPHHCRVCGARVCGKCSEERLFVPCFQVDEALRVCKVCAVELQSAKCARFNIVVAPSVSSDSAIGKKGSMIRPACDPPVFQSDADAKLAEAMGVLARYKEEHETELAELRAELQPNQPVEERRKTKAAMNTKALEAMTVSEKVDSLVSVAAKRAIQQNASKYGAMKRGQRGPQGTITANSAVAQQPSAMTSLPPPLPPLATTTIPPVLSTEGSTSPKQPSSPKQESISERSPSPPAKSGSRVTVFELMPPPPEPAPAPVRSSISVSRLPIQKDPQIPRPTSPPVASPPVSASWRGKRAAGEELQAEVMLARSMASQSSASTSPPTAVVSPHTGGTFRAAGKFKPVAPLLPPPSLSTPPISTSTVSVRTATAAPLPVQLSAKPKALAKPAPPTTIPPPVSTFPAAPKPASELSLAVSSIPSPLASKNPLAISATLLPHSTPDSPLTSPVTSPITSPRSAPLPPPPAVSAMVSPRTKAVLPTTAPPPSIAQSSSTRRITETDKEMRSLDPAKTAAPEPLRERVTTDPTRPKLAALALPPPPVVSSGKARKPVALPTVKPPKPTFDAVLGALDAATEALATDAVKTAAGEPPAQVQTLPVYRAKRTVKPASNRELALRAGDVVMVADSSTNADWWFGISSGAAGWFPSSAVTLAQEASFAEDEPAPIPIPTTNPESAKLSEEKAAIEQEAAAEKSRKEDMKNLDALKPKAPAKEGEDSAAKKPDIKEDGYLPYRKKFVWPKKAAPVAATSSKAPAPPPIATQEAPPPATPPKAPPPPATKQESTFKRKPAPLLPSLSQEPIRACDATAEVSAVAEPTETLQADPVAAPEEVDLDAEFADLDQLEAELTKEKSTRQARVAALADDEPVEQVPWSPWAALTSGPSAILFDEDAPVSLSPRKGDALDEAMQGLLDA